MGDYVPERPGELVGRKNMKLFYSVAVSFVLAVLVVLLINANSTRPMICKFQYMMMVCEQK